MFYEYALISVIIASGYWGIFFLRRPPNGNLTFGLMQLGAALLSGLGLYGARYSEARWLGVAGAIGLGAGACLLVVGPVVRGLARRFASAERLGIAARLLDIAELLAPGSGVAEEKAVLGAMKEIRDGRIEETVDALTAAKDRAPGEAKRAIDERIALLYLAAYRWDDAIKHAEENLFGAIPRGRSHPEGGDEQPSDEAPLEQPTSLRAALGIAPPVWVELLGAYGRTGNLDQAARMLSRLEDVCDGREDAAIWVHRGRLMFLALAGRPAAVQALVEPRRARHMSLAARTYWMAVAHEHGGDRAAASAAYTKARTRSRGRPRALIDQALERIAKLDSATPIQLSPIASEVVARVEAAPLPAPIRIERAVQPWATWSITAILVGVAGAISLFAGSTGDPGVLVRAGAMVRGMIDGGEWWRLVSCVFVHVGVVHLAVNGIGMFFLGRVAEELFGTARTFALFGLCGIAGAIASYLASPAGVSAGASGAIFGMLGAVFVELTWHRRKYRAAWKRGMWGGLVVVTVAQLGVGFLYPMIDQWAHGAGLAAGVVFGAALTPSASWSRVTLYAGRVLAVLLAALSITAAVLVATRSIEDSFANLPEKRHVIGNVAITAPASYVADIGLDDPDSIVLITPLREPLVALVPQMTQSIALAVKIGKERGFEDVSAAADRVIALPVGWEGTEHLGSFEDPMGTRQHYRILVAGKVFDSSLVMLIIMTPDSIARVAPTFFTKLVASTAPAP
jgi:membrane associated rhomboid family serine protease